MISWPERFASDDLARLEDDRALASASSALPAATVAALSERWRPVVQPQAKHEEPFDLVDDAGHSTGVALVITTAAGSR